MQPFVTTLRVTRVNRIVRGYSDAYAEYIAPATSREFITFGVGWLVCVCLSTELHASPTKEDPPSPLPALTAAEEGWRERGPIAYPQGGWGLASSGGVEGCSGAL